MRLVNVIMSEEGKFFLEQAVFSYGNDLPALIVIFTVTVESLK
jgi:hypothetical protein